MSNPSAPPPYEDRNPYTQALRPLGAMGSHPSCREGILPTLATRSLATVTLLATHSPCPHPPDAYELRPRPWL